MQFCIRTVPHIVNTSFIKCGKIGGIEKCWYDPWIFNRVIRIFTLWNKNFIFVNYADMNLWSYTSTSSLSIYGMYRGDFLLNLCLCYRDIMHRVETQGLNVHLIGNIILFALRWTVYCTTASIMMLMMITIIIISIIIIITTRQ